jgi:hypothetical protein
VWRNELAILPFANPARADTLFQARENKTHADTKLMRKLDFKSIHWIMGD